MKSMLAVITLWETITFLKHKTILKEKFKKIQYNLINISCSIRQTSGFRLKKNNYIPEKCIFIIIKQKKVYEITKVFQVNLESIGVEIMVNFTQYYLLISSRSRNNFQFESVIVTNTSIYRLMLTITPLLTQL